MSARTRNAVAVALLLLGAVATFVAAVAVYANHVIGDRDGFARKVVEAVHQPAVSREISPRLTSALVDAVPDAVVVQREIDDAATALIASGALDPIVHRAALTLHDAALTDSARNLALDLADGLQLMSSFVATQRPDLTSRLDPDVTAEVADLRDDGWVPPLGDVARAVNRLAWILAVLALALLVGAVVAARDRAGRWAAWAWRSERPASACSWSTSW